MPQEARDLRDAIQAQNLHLVKEAIRAGANLTQALPGHSYNALYLAIDVQAIEIIKYLIKMGAEVDYEDWWYNCHTPLTLAIQKNNLEIVKLLVSHGADVNRIHTDGDTPLSQAVRLNRLQIAEFLIEKGANIDQIGWKGLTPLSWAITKNNQEAVNLLTAHGADKTKPNSDNSTPVELEAKEKPLDVSKYVKTWKKKTNKGKMEKKKEEEKDDKVETTETIKPVVSNYDGDIPLIKAIHFGQTDVVEQLLTSGVDPCKPGVRGKTALLVAVQKKDMEIIKLLLDHGAEHTIQTAFLEAIALEEFEIVKLLTEKGALLNVIYKSGYTPLTKAIETGKLELVEYLVENGALTNMPDRDGNYPFTVAVRKGNMEIVRHLLKNTHLPDDLMEKCPFLLKYIDEHNFDMVQSIVEMGVHLDVVFETGNSPLTKAVQVEDFQIVKYLVKRCANINLADRNGKTPLAIAADKQNLRIVKFLIANNADIKLARKELENYAMCNEDFAIFLDVIKGKYTEWERNVAITQYEQLTDVAEDIVK